MRTRSNKGNVRVETLQTDIVAAGVRTVRACNFTKPYCRVMGAIHAACTLAFNLLPNLAAGNYFLCST